MVSPWAQTGSAGENREEAAAEISGYEIASDAG
jgi:hypothetical protein